MRLAPLIRLILLIIITKMMMSVATCAQDRPHVHDSVVVLIDASESMFQACGSDQTKLQVAESFVERLRQQGRRVASARIENPAGVSQVLDDLLRQTRGQSVECVWLTDGVSIEASSAINALCNHWNRTPNDWKFRLIGVCATPNAAARLRSIAKLTCGEVELVEGIWKEPKEAPECPSCKAKGDSKECRCEHRSELTQLFVINPTVKTQGSDDTKAVSRSGKLRTKKILSNLDSLSKQTRELRSYVDRRETEFAKVMEQFASAQAQSHRRQSRLLRKLSEDFKNGGEVNGWWRPGIVGAITGLTLLSLAAWMKLLDLKRRMESSERDVSERRLEAIERSLMQLHQQPVSPQQFYGTSTSPTASPPIASPPIASPPIASPPMASPPMERLPVGTIVIWSGSVHSIPQGWTLCDGENGTPDLRGRFVIGSGTDASTGKHQVGSRGGAECVILELDHLPRHSHRGKTEASGGHGHTLHRSGSEQPLGLDYAGEQGTQTISSGADHRGPSQLETNHVDSHEHEFKTESCGNNIAHENLPPYHALCYIMKKSE